MLLKKLMMLKLSALVGASLLVSGCVTGIDSREDKMANGAALGGLVGGVLAYNFAGAGTSQWIMTMLGAVGGAAAGSRIMDEATKWERKEMEGTIYRSLTESTTGETLTWQPSEEETMGRFTPVRTFLDQQGRICRDLMIESIVDGEKSHATQTMCRNGAGHWFVS